MRSLIVLVVSLSTLGCVARNRATGSVHGRAVSLPLTSGEYCAHCRGGEEVTIEFKSEAGVVVLSTDACLDGFTDRVGEGGASIYVRSSARQGASEERVVDGKIEMKSCNTERAVGSFRAELEDGSELSGSFDAKLRYYAGYD